MTRVAVLGANGQLGRDVTLAFAAEGYEVTALTHEDIEIASLGSVTRSLESAHPAIIVNAAAFSNVDKCEADPAVAFAVNGIGAHNVGVASGKLGAKVLHISTDYVFDGAKRSPYTELDSPCPMNVYGNTKLSGEYFVRSANPSHFIVRVSGIYGQHPCRSKGGLNFVELMLKLSREREEVRVVDDEFVTPTPTIEIARQLVVLSQTSDYGLYHATAEGSCSWFEFAQAIFELTGTKVRLERARPNEFPATAPRPKYSVLENAALKSRNLNIFSHWKKALQNYVLARETSPAAVVSKL